MKIIAIVSGLYIWTELVDILARIAMLSSSNGSTDANVNQYCNMLLTYGKYALINSTGVAMTLLAKYNIAKSKAIKFVYYKITKNLIELIENA